MLNPHVLRDSLPSVWHDDVVGARHARQLAGGFESKRRRNAAGVGGGGTRALVTTLGAAGSLGRSAAERLVRYRWGRLRHGCNLD